MHARSQPRPTPPRPAPPRPAPPRPALPSPAQPSPACTPHFLAVPALHHPVVAVKGQLVAQQVQQAGLWGVVLRPAPAQGRGVGGSERRVAARWQCVCAGRRGEGAQGRGGEQGLAGS